MAKVLSRKRVVHMAQLPHPPSSPVCRRSQARDQMALAGSHKPLPAVSVPKLLLGRIWRLKLLSRVSSLDLVQAD